MVTHGQLLKEIWGKNSQGQEHYLRIHIHKLRQKIEQDPARPRYLRTETGMAIDLSASVAPLIYNARSGQQRVVFASVGRFSCLH